MSRVYRAVAAARVVARRSLVVMCLVAGCGAEPALEAEDRDETTTSWTAGDDAPLDLSPDPMSDEEPGEGAGE